MALKRKRSSELFTLFNSPARSDSSMESFDFPVSPIPAFPRAFATPSHLPSRTMKRFRDNRPSEEEVHQRTLNLLYSAQQQTQHPTTQPSEASTPSPPAPGAARSTQKSLHSFWNIASAAPSFEAASAPSIDGAAVDPVSCEDCGAGLGSSGDAAGGMEVDDYGDAFEAERQCGACRKHVCSHCSITNLGERRRCLRCAGGKAWPASGGSGWTTSSVGIF